MMTSKYMLRAVSAVTLSALSLVTGCAQEGDEDIEVSGDISAVVAGTEVTLTGTAEVSFVDSRDENGTQHSELQYYLLRSPTDSAPVKLEIQGASPSFATGDAISVTGKVQVEGGVRSIAVENVRLSVAQATQASLTARQPAAHKALVLLVGATKTTVPQMQAMFNASSPGSFAAFVAENSGKLDTFTAEVFSLPSVDTSTCDVDRTPIKTAANAAFEKTGRKISSYSNVVYIIGGTKCPWFASATTGHPGSLVPEVAQYSDSAVSCNNLAHELGHNLGLAHAHSTSCGSNIYNSSRANCTDTPYGNPFDPMGYAASGCNSRGHYSAAYKRYEGYLPGCADVTDLATSATFTLSPLEGTCGTRSVRIPIAGEAAGQSNYYYLEYRKAGLTPFSGAGGKSRVLLTVANDPSAGAPDEYLLDSTPTTKTFEDAELTVGKTYSLPGRVNITLVSMGSVATIKVTTPYGGKATCQGGATPPVVGGKVGAVCN